jgi:hypothetical protein
MIQSIERRSLLQGRSAGRDGSVPRDLHRSFAAAASEHPGAIGNGRLTVAAKKTTGLLLAGTTTQQNINGFNGEPIYLPTGPATRPSASIDLLRAVSPAQGTVTAR